MINEPYIDAWRQQAAPWKLPAMVEQDLILSRVIVELFSENSLREAIAFRGGTAIHKLCFTQAKRYSEDLDFVQINAGPIKPVIAPIRRLLDPWLGAPKYKATNQSAKLLYRFESEVEPVQTMRVKIEINTREHFVSDQHRVVLYEIKNPWFSGGAEVTTFNRDELFATKFRALHQRKKGRDLFDLFHGLNSLELSPHKIADIVQNYANYNNQTITRAMVEESLAGKTQDPAFLQDILPLLPHDSEYDPVVAYEVVSNQLIPQLPGEPWKGLKE